MKNVLILWLLIIGSNSFSQTTNIDSLGLVKANEEKNKEYQKRIYKADSLFDLKDFKNAREFYVGALDISPAEMYPKNRIQEIDKHVSYVDSRQYDKIILKADECFQLKSYQLSKDLYNRALMVSPSQVYPKEKIVEIDKIVEAKKQYFYSLIQDADSLFEKKNFVLAKGYYLKAYVVDSSKTYPVSQVRYCHINICPDCHLDYIKYAVDGDLSFSLKDYSKAEEHYSMAFLMDGSSESHFYVMEMLEKCSDEISKLKERDKKYNQFISEGDLLFSNGKYEEAARKYNYALMIMDHDYPRGQIVKINKILNI